RARVPGRRHDPFRGRGRGGRTPSMAARPVTAYPITVHPETLRHYALLADGERGALVGPRGNVSFLCAPRWHDEAVLSDLVGGRGTYVVRPAEERFVWGGSYEPGSLIWR